jgi:hypothetical protein
MKLKQYINFFRGRNGQMKRGVMLLQFPNQFEFYSSGVEFNAASV